eukprot:gene13598-biopygen6964
MSSFLWNAAVGRRRVRISLVCAAGGGVGFPTIAVGSSRGDPWGPRGILEGRREVAGGREGAHADVEGILARCVSLQNGLYFRALGGPWRRGGRGWISGGPEGFLWDCVGVLGDLGGSSRAAAVVFVDGVVTGSYNMPGARQIRR